LRPLGLRNHCSSGRRGEDFGRLKYAMTETLHLSPLPCWNHLPPEVWKDRTFHLIQEIEEEAATRRSRTGSQPLGAAAIRGQHPHDRPKCPKKSPALLFHTWSSKMRHELWEAYTWFVAAFQDASEKLPAGGRHAAFPLGKLSSGPTLRGRVASLTDVGVSFSKRPGRSVSRG
jgi:hypothetical protein